MRAITYVTKDPNFIEAMMAGRPEKNLEASDDGQNLASGGEPERRQRTRAHDFVRAVTAKFFRVTFKATPPPPLPDWAAGLDPASFGMRMPPKPTSYEIAELVLHSDPRVNRFEEKAAFVPEPDLYGYATSSVDPSDAIRKSDVIDLTSKMQPDGTLDWTPPDGRLGRAALRLLAARHHQPPRHHRSYGP